MPTYPDYVRQTLARAREEGQWHAAQADAAALCFDILALFPDCQEAGDLVYELFCDEWTIYDMRVAVQRQVDEWDDRPSEHRRRLALSFRFMSRWDGWYREYEKGYEREQQYLGDKQKENLLSILFGVGIRTNSPERQQGEMLRRSRELKNLLDEAKTKGYVKG